MSWRIEVDGGTCIGSGMCSAIAEGYFELVDGVSQPVRAEVDPADDVVDAAESCPVEAITVREADSGRKLAPEY
ncbi:MULTISPECIES: ferredoxin [Actinopolyspora]|uniref:Ferredoxin n=1 Tax=Actinopolyspora saharensis TaxID=995062 RepID=A0A1H1DHY4_9ACTN|nr:MULTISPECIES: ferredoxin [Actinopolyspora]NHD18465.1 ferredoxin [Actinopolyspora sp. BKK2]NHE77576.1 ferredoxin [Actinopolyspora sp. BKK1]SDQ75808.1 ferredoxin [Actinopolyspora saharensis]